MPQGSIEIFTYRARTTADAPVHDEAGSPQPRRPIPESRISRLTDRIPGALVGAVVSLLLHALLLTSVLWEGGALRAHRPDARLSGSARTRGTDEDAAMQWIVLQMTPGPSVDATPRNAPPLAPVALPTLQADWASVAAELDAEFASETTPGTSSSAADSPSDGHELVAMAGRYIGQISARIDRAWLRPRTPIGAPTFSCRVRIDQDHAGNVLDITLEHCNGDARWQHSLVEAIESASPLPAPPDPAVFAPTVHMGFQALAYTPGAPQGEYEPKGLAQVAQTVAPGDNAQSALDRFREALKMARPNQLINLTITSPADESSPEGPPPVLQGPEEIPPDSDPR